MSIFARPHYTSEVTSFIEELKAKKPTLEAEQRQGRAIWWDKKLDLSEQGGYGSSDHTSFTTKQIPVLFF
ncbi:MAG: DUF3460 family protein, partial [Polaromonas sp.]|nr:DUF3460 family protein [Polaromonas sp.]